MKPGMTAIAKQKIGGYWVWLAQTSDEWATYVSISDDENETMYGHYFDKKLNAVVDYNKRVKTYS
jgi:hypothetical protein